MKRLMLLLALAVGCGGCGVKFVGPTSERPCAVSCEAAQLAALERIAAALERQANDECIIGTLVDKGVHKTLVLGGDGTCHVEATCQDVDPLVILQDGKRIPNGEHLPCGEGRK